MKGSCTCFGSGRDYVRLPSGKEVFNVSSISWAGTGSTLLLGTLLEAGTVVELKDRSTEDLHCGKFSAFGC